MGIRVKVPVPGHSHNSRMVVRHYSSPQILLVGESMLMMSPMYSIMIYLMSLKVTFIVLEELHEQVKAALHMHFVMIAKVVI